MRTSNQLPGSESNANLLVDLTGTTLLYVGGRVHQVAQLRMLAEKQGATLLHHDGGIDDRSGLLAAQVARADFVSFRSTASATTPSRLSNASPARLASPT
jgi:hypothetical protein